jgi:tRNA threonylcarbamoyladenosine biosynthesis protein TsaB
MAVILNIDTTSPLCSVCIAQDGQPIVTLQDALTQQHAQSLTVMVQAAIAEAGYTTHTLDAIALSGGPGSFTGLRIGAATAKGLCYGLDKPLISVPTHQGIAVAMKGLEGGKDALYITMTDARRADVYLAGYDSTLLGVIPEGFFTLEEKLLDVLGVNMSIYQVFFGGSGIEKLKKYDFAKFGTIIENISYHSSNIALLSYMCFQQGAFQDVMYYEPFYFKPFAHSKPDQ